MQIACLFAYLHITIYTPTIAAGCSGVNTVSILIGTEIDPEWSHGPRTNFPVPGPARDRGVDGSTSRELALRIAGPLPPGKNEFKKSGVCTTGSLGRDAAPLVTNAGGWNAGRGGDGMACLGVLVTRQP